MKVFDFAAKCRSLSCTSMFRLKVPCLENSTQLGNIKKHWIARCTPLAFDLSAGVTLCRGHTVQGSHCAGVTLVGVTLWGTSNTPTRPNLGLCSLSIMGKRRPGYAARSTCMICSSACHTHTHACSFLGWTRCDARRSLTETKQQFPGVDFSLIQSEDDTVWPQYNGGVKFNDQGRRINEGNFGEPETHVTERGIQFLHWLMDR